MKFKTILTFATMIALNLCLSGCATSTPPVIIAPVIDFAKYGCKPEYPRAALRNEETGVVDLLLVVEANGSISKADVIKSTGFPLLDNAVKNQMLAGQCKAKPGTVNGQPQKASMKIRYVWKLEELNHKVSAFETAVGLSKIQGANSNPVAAVVPINSSCSELEGKNAWVYRQTINDAAKGISVLYIQFHVLYTSMSGDSIIEYVKGEQGSIKRNFGKNNVHNVSFSIPKKTCLVDIMDGRSISPNPTIPFTPTIGAQWTENRTIKGTNVASEYKVAALEEVKVGAGIFKSIKIEIISYARDSNMANEKNTATELNWNERRCTSWYASEVKTMAKSTCDFFDKSHRILSLTDELDVYDVSGK